MLRRKVRALKYTRMFNYLPLTFVPNVARVLNFTILESTLCRNKMISLHLVNVSIHMDFSTFVSWKERLRLEPWGHYTVWTHQFVCDQSHMNMGVFCKSDDIATQLKTTIELTIINFCWSLLAEKSFSFCAAPSHILKHTNLRRTWLCPTLPYWVSRLDTPTTHRHLIKHTCFHFTLPLVQVER